MANYRTPSSSGGTDEEFTRSVFRNGRFVNPWSTWKKPNIGGVLKMLIFDKNHSRVPSKRVLDETLPIVTPDFTKISSSPDKGVQVTWIGHATVLVQFDGITLITDPVFSQRCSPFPFSGPKRYRDLPCTVHDLPKLDAVVISHNHYDHLDYATVQLFNARFGSELRWFVPRGLLSWMQQAGCDNVIELDWWDENCIPEHPDFKFVFTPAQHWCKRSVADDNKVLWGSWCVIGPHHRFFFAGDTGLCAAFEQIGNKYGPFDLAAIPIGAYEPRWFLSFQHVNPKEAVTIHRKVKAKKSVGIHWGTFPLSYEFYLEPPEKLREALDEKNISQEDFFVLKHGESKLVGLENAD